MKNIALTAAAIVSVATASQAKTTIKTIGNHTYINSYGTSGFSSTVCTTIGTTVYCN